MTGRDYFGKTADLSRIRLWLLDMDGTIYRENSLFPGTLPFLRAIRAHGGRYLFLTNNSSNSVRDYLEQLTRMGVCAEKADFFTSAQAAARLLSEQYPGKKVYCQGTASLVRELREAGIDVTEEVEPVDIVLLGFDLELTSEKLRRTCQILTEQNPVYLATNPDIVCPVSFGFVPDCGSISKMIQNATGKWPVFIGKPEPTMIRIVMERCGCAPEQTAMVGDRLYTDIAAGLNAGVASICVLSGEATLSDLEQTEFHPDYTFSDVGAIARLLEKE